MHRIALILFLLSALASSSPALCAPPDTLGTRSVDGLLCLGPIGDRTLYLAPASAPASAAPAPSADPATPYGGSVPFLYAAPTTDPTADSARRALFAQLNPDPTPTDPRLPWQTDRTEPHSNAPRPAAAHCAALGLRLPTTDELARTVALHRLGRLPAPYALDPKAEYWTADTHSLNSAVVVPLVGAPYAAYRNALRAVRCVRSEPQ